MKLLDDLVAGGFERIPFAVAVTVGMIETILVGDTLDVTVRFVIGCARHGIHAGPRAGLGHRGIFAVLSRLDLADEAGHSRGVLCNWP